MFALRSGQDGAGAAMLPNLAARFGAGRFVLPRFLRRPARLFSRLVNRETPLPRFCASIGTVGFLALTGAYGAVVGGHVPGMVETVSSKAGFAVDDVRISGNRETSEIDILGLLGLDGATSLLALDAQAARQRIAELPWVASADVRKIYPDTVAVTLKERRPFAIWQSGSQLSLIESSGDVIVPFGDEKYATLPLVIGFGAAQKAAGFIASVAAYPELAGRVKGYIRVADRRWDLRLENGVTVKLPENDAAAAIADLMDLDRTHGILSRDIATVDMRLGDRLVIGLTPEAAVRRDAALKERLKQAGRPEKHI